MTRNSIIELGRCSLYAWEHITMLVLLIGGVEMLDTLNVARYIINYSNQEKYGISNLRLQKLLYFVQAYYLISSGNPCFGDCIEAWDFGPVVPVVYHEFKRFGGSSIPPVESYIVFNSDNFWDSHSALFDEKCLPDEDREKIRHVVDKFSDYSTAALVSLTHNQRPWKDAYDKPQSNRVISNDSIQKYFQPKS